jgi:hypothetical protein
MWEEGREGNGREDGEGAEEEKHYKVWYYNVLGIEARDYVFIPILLPCS